MALASDTCASSVVGLSESPVFHHQYSSITAAISHLAKNEQELKLVRRLFQQQWLEYFPFGRIVHWQTDGVPVFREHSPSLNDRQYIHKSNNVVPGNKPIGVGYPLSLVNRADLESSWSLPFEMRRVKSSEDEIEVGAGQIKQICQREEFKEVLNVNSCDSKYGVAKYISKVAGVGNLINVIRLRHGIKVYQAVRRETGGAPQIYGPKHYLIEKSGEKKYQKKTKEYVVYQRSIYEEKADEDEIIFRQTKKGRRLRIELRKWKGMKMRTKNGHQMKDVEFDLVGIRVLDEETNERVFKRDMFLAVVGQERERLSLAEQAEEYYHRFDLEVTNRFMKQEMFLQGYQTPKKQNVDNWLVVVQEAMWLLWAASKEVENVCSKWQKYAEPKEEKGGRKTVSQTKKGAGKLFLTFESEKFQPKKCKKGFGRKKGARQEPRKQYKVVKKGKARVELTKSRPKQE